MNGYLDRTILHVDIDGFHANVECSRDPSIRDKPVAVSGDWTRRKGVITARNMLAKYRGVNAGQCTKEALEICPELIIKQRNPQLYKEYSNEIFHNTLTKYSDFVEVCSEDEAWLDITTLTRNPYEARKIAKEFQADIKETTGLTCSVGIADNKIYSKIGSDLRKPAACTIITPENYKELVWTLPCDKLLYINTKTKRRLGYAKIHTIGDVANAPEGLLECLFDKWGWYMQRFANGNVRSPVKHKNYIRPNKSIGRHETTIRDMVTIEDVRKVLYARAEELAYLLRQQRSKCRTVQVTIRENNLKSCARQGKLEMPSFVTGHIAEKAIEIFQIRYNFTTPLRSIGITACDLIPENESIQMDLFYDMDEYDRQERLERSIDRLRDIHGFDVVRRAIVYADKDLTFGSPDNYSLHLTGDYNLI